MTVRASSTSRPDPSRWRTMSATHSVTCSTLGGSECRCRSCRRTDPMSIEVDSCGPSSPSTSSVEPPPMSTTSTGSGGIADSPPTAPAYARAASSGPDSTCGVTPRRARTPSTKTAALRASRVAEVAQNRMRSGGTPCSRSIPANSSMAEKVRASASAASSPVVSTPWPRRTTRESRSTTSGGVPMSSLMELVPQSIAATRSVIRAGPLDAGPAGPPLAQQVEHLVAERVDARGPAPATGRPGRAGT